MILKSGEDPSVREEILRRAVFELIRRTSFELPQDVEKALHRALASEEPTTTAALILSSYLKNMEMAREREAPLCQDTGTPLFFVSHPADTARDVLVRCIKEAVIKATEKEYLRPNAVDAVSGKNSGNNIGKGFPSIYFTEGVAPGLVISLILKGGGSENVGCQYSLPDGELDAGRDLEGVRRVVLDAVWKAGGNGCPPGVLGVCIGGDRGSGYLESKRQLLRQLDDVNTDLTLAELESRLLREANLLGIGPLGLGGKSTLLAVKIGALHRAPASFFVTVTYMCWEYRRRTLFMNADGTYRII